jgi:hypothetical protein
VSRNARRQRGRHEERFVTQRCRGAGRATAKTRLDALHVDRGWLDSERWGDRQTVCEDLFGSGTSEYLSTPATFQDIYDAVLPAERTGCRSTSSTT